MNCLFVLLFLIFQGKFELCLKIFQSYEISFLIFRSEYLIFQKILKLEYEFPEGFCEEAKDLVQKLLVMYHLIFCICLISFRSYVIIEILDTVLFKALML